MRVVISTLAALLLLLAVGPAASAQPIADVATCNEEARRLANGPSASPGTKAQPPTLTPERGMRTDRSGSVVAEAKDPFLEGMAAEGLDDPVYRTAYRACMAARRGPGR